MVKLPYKHINLIYFCVIMELNNLAYNKLPVGTKYTLKRSTINPWGTLRVMFIFWHNNLFFLCRNSCSKGVGEKQMNNWSYNSPVRQLKKKTAQKTMVGKRLEGSGRRITFMDAFHDHFKVYWGYNDGCSIQILEQNFVVHCAAFSE